MLPAVADVAESFWCGSFWNPVDSGVNMREAVSKVNLTLR